MSDPDLPPVQTDNELYRWATDITRQVFVDRNVIVFRSPSGAYTLFVERNRPISGYLLELYATDDDESRLARTIVDDRELALEVAGQMAAAADEPHALPASSDLHSGSASHATSRSPIETPEKWEDDDNWDDAIEDTYEKAEIRG